MTAQDINEQEDGSAQRFRVATWNIACWKPGHFNDLENRRRIWGEIAAIGADLYLLQEANISDFDTCTADWFRDDYQIIHHVDRDQGSCIVARASVQPEAVAGEGLLDDFKSRFTIARITMPDGYERIVASVHPSARALTESDIADDQNEKWRRSTEERAWQNDGFVRAFSDQFTAAHAPFLIGGDWNTARLFDVTYPDSAPSGQEFFDTTASLGWTELHRRMHVREQQTYIDPASAPYQLDHLFSEAALANRMTRCDVFDGNLLREVSDHLPLVADFELQTT